MVQQTPQGGGNAIYGQANRPSSLSKISVRRMAAIGDVLASTVVADKLADLGYGVSWQSNPIIHPILRRQGRIESISGQQAFTHVNLDGYYENHPMRRQRHFSDLFMEKANTDLSRFGIQLGPPINCLPHLSISDSERELVRAKFSPYPKPHVFFCPRSDWYACRQVPDFIWEEAAKTIVGTKFWIGRLPAPKGFVDLKATELDTLIVWISAADLMVSVDTGPMHIAAALGIPIVGLCQASSPELHLSDQRDFITIYPPGLDCLNCQKNQCPKDIHLPPCQRFDPQAIAHAVNQKLNALTHDGVSAVIPIYRPELDVLNRCLDCLLPQVDEIVVAMEGKSILPQGARTHPKIRYFQKAHQGVGFGRNVNFGVRHSNHRWVLIINDDVFLPQNAVAELRKRALNGVGMVVHQLRYPDGLIYPVAMKRQPGARDWYHVDYRAQHSSITDDIELETCCGASELIRRDLFYQIGGYDEGFFMYCEDNDLALRLRQVGSKVLFTPHVCGTHINGASSKKLGIPQQQMIQESGRRFHAKWDRYLKHNQYNAIGNFNY